ncbi:MAG: acetolactate synthase small subunit [Ruminococcus sp.]|nr:acetolactate synthase small subunit [Ruminococcus sp.]
MQYTLSILVENQAGVLSKISGLFSRRGYNIDSITVGTTNDSNVSRITIVANGDEYVVEQIEKQLNKLIPVIKVKRLNEGDFISRELILIKVHCPAAKRSEIILTAEIMQAKIVDVAQSCVTVEYCECASRVNTLIDLLKPYGIREIVRTGTVAIDRGTASVSV